MSWRGDRYKLADNGEEQAANQGACQEMGRLYDGFICCRGGDSRKREEVGCSSQPEISSSPSRPHLSSLVTKGDCVQAALVGRSADIPTPRSSDHRASTL